MGAGSPKHAIWTVSPAVPETEACLPALLGAVAGSTVKAGPEAKANQTSGSQPVL